MSIWHRWCVGQPVRVRRGPFENRVGVLQDASGETDGRIDKARVLQVAFAIGERAVVVWLAEDDCEVVLGEEA